MGSVTIRNIAEEVKQAARLAAVKNGRSMEAELRALLERTYGSANQDRAAWLRGLSGPELVAHLAEVSNGAVFDAPKREAENVEFSDL